MLKTVYSSKIRNVLITACRQNTVEIGYWKPILIYQQHFLFELINVGKTKLYTFNSKEVFNLSNTSGK